MTKKLKEPIMRFHRIHLGGDQEITVRTNGTTFEKQEVEKLEQWTSLKNLADQVNRILKDHPDAEVKTENEPYDEGTYPVAKWWVPLEETDPLVVDVLVQAKAAEEAQRQRDAKELERLKKERPDLFEKK